MEGRAGPLRLVAEMPRRLRPCVLLLAVLGAFATPPVTSTADGSVGCTHGVSAAGPVVFENGRYAGGSTTPVTEACLP